MLKRTSWLMAGSALALVCGATSVFAADAPAATPAAAPAGAQSQTMGEIVVTARRREETLQKVPKSIAAFSQQTLTEKSITEPFALDKAVPGFSVTANSGNGGRANFAIRGRGQNYGAAAGSVETYFDDVPLSGPYQMPAFAPQFFDLQSVQVAKGPQGTLFGRSTTGGAVLFVPQAPTGTFGGYGRVQGGDYGDFQAEAAVNLPLIGDRVDLRLAGFDWQRNGYSRTLAGNYDDFGRLLPSQTYDNQNVQQFRATLLVRPTDKLTNSTMFAYDQENNRSTPHAAVIDSGSQLGGGILYYFPNILSLGPRVADINVNLDHPTDKAYAVINKTTYDLTPNLMIKNIFGYIHTQGGTNCCDDSDGSPLGVIDLITDLKQSQNIGSPMNCSCRVTNFNDRLTWIVGGMIDDTYEPSGDNINIYTTNVGSNFDTTWQQNTYRDEGIFGSLTYKITDSISVTAGERHSWDNINVLDREGSTGSPTQFLANSSASPAGAIAAGWAMQPDANHSATIRATPTTSAWKISGPGTP